MSGRKPVRVDQKDLSMGSLASFSFFPLVAAAIPLGIHTQSVRLICSLIAKYDTAFA